jgi:hypothetical protein
MVMKFRYGQVTGCFELVVKYDSTKDGRIVFSETTNTLRNTMLCDITNASVLSYILFSLAQLVVLFRSFSFGALDSAVYLTSRCLIGELEKDVAKGGREIIEKLVVLEFPSRN